MAFPQPLDILLAYFTVVVFLGLVISLLTTGAAYGDKRHLHRMRRNGLRRIVAQTVLWTHALKASAFAGFLVTAGAAIVGATNAPTIYTLWVARLGLAVGVTFLLANVIRHWIGSQEALDYNAEQDREGA